jgi:hypothetical protein
MTAQAEARALPGVAALKPALVFAGVECWYFGRLPACFISTALSHLLSVTIAPVFLASDFGTPGGVIDLD